MREYGIPASEKKRLGESKTVALEIIEDILVKNLAMYLMPEPKVTNVERLTVKLATQHMRSQSNGLLSESGTQSIVSHTSNGSSSKNLQNASPNTVLGSKRFNARYGSSIKVNGGQNKAGGSRSVTQVVGNSHHL